MKKATLLLMLFPLVAVAGNASVSSMTVQQRSPWNGLVDIAVTIQGSAEDVEDSVCAFAATNSATKAAIPVEHISQNGEDVGSDNTWTRKFIWDAKADVGAVKIDDVALTVNVGQSSLGGVQLWENGPYWAECNVGASQPEECGYYFWWGDTVGYKRNAADNGWVSVKDGSSFSFSGGNGPTFGKDNSQLQSAGYIDATCNLLAAHDAATAHLGAPWRMPTDADLSALIANCDTEWTSHNGVSGWFVKGRGAYASKSIFLPAAGYGIDSGLYNIGLNGDYWSSTPYSNYPRRAWGLYFNSGGFNRGNFDRGRGQPVRPVRGFAGSSAASRGVTTHIALDCSSLENGQVAVTSVTAQQRYPWNGLVDITVTLQGSADDLLVTECAFAATNSATKAAIPVEHITRNGNDTSSGTVWTRKFIWDAKADVGAVKIDDVALTVDVGIDYGGVQLWGNGPYWAECNVGASQPEECGYYFWWGDTVGYKRNAADNGWVSVKDGASFSFDSGHCPTYNKNNSQLQSAGYIDATGNLVAAHDAATVHLSAPWRMPTDAEFSALISNCDTEWTSRNGVSGRLVKGRGAYASKSIFLPAAGVGSDSGIYNLGLCGEYWSSTPLSGHSDYAFYAYFHSGDTGYFIMGVNGRDDGRSVRPVRRFAGSSTASGGVTTHLSLDCREGARKISADGEELRYDVGWYADADSVRISENGTVVETGTRGTYKWQLEASCATQYALKLEVLAGNQVLTIETAEFVNNKPALDHAGTVTKPAIEPTSSQPGMTAEISCTRCGEVFQAAEEIPALGYIRNVTARQLWPHKKVEVCYEIAEDIGEVADESGAVVLTCEGVLVAPELTFTSSSSYPWTMDSETYKGSGPSHKSGGRKVGNAKSTLYCSVSGATQVSFWWKVSSEQNYDKLHFYVDGTEKATAISGDVDWTLVTVDLGSSSSHILEWSYEKDESFDHGIDCGWVDCIDVKYVSTAMVEKTLQGETLLGDTRCTPGHHRVVWDMEADDVGIKEDQAIFRVKVADVDEGGLSQPTHVDTSSLCADGMAVAGTMTLRFSPINAQEVEVQIDGVTLLSSVSSGEYEWMPVSLGEHTLKHIAGTNAWTRTVNVTSLAFVPMPQPHPPMAADANVKITQTSHLFTSAAGTFAIPVQGVNGYTGTYAASVSDSSWITINSAEANWKAGRPLVYGVTANDGAGERVGYVYISGHVHTITQTGVGAELSAYVADVEMDGGTVEVTALAAAGVSWNARPNVGWLSVSPTSGTGEGIVTITVAPWNDISTRSGTVMIAGRTLTVRQRRRCLQLDKIAAEVDWQAQIVNVTVDAPEDVEWSVDELPDWVTVAGEDGGFVHLAIGENPSYVGRSGVVRIGTETLTISQGGRTTDALTFGISPEATVASAKGGDGIVAVTATPDLPWAATSAADWLTVGPDAGEGEGNGNITYIAAPNPTMAERTGTIIVTPEAASGLAAKTLTVRQSAATSHMAETEHMFAGEGESFDVAVSVDEVVGWTVTGGADWISFGGSAMRQGPGKVTIVASANLTVNTRETTIVIAGHEFRIVQSGRTVELEYASISFDAEVGGEGMIEVYADEGVQWMASPSDWNWISIWGDDACDYDADGNIVDEGDGVVHYYISPPGDGRSHTGWIQIGDKRLNVALKSGVSIEVAGDVGAVITGDEETGFTVKPSAGKTHVEISIPDGLDPSKVTVVVGTAVETVMAKGAKVRVVSGVTDITEFLNMPVADGDGVIDLTKATVKEEIVKEAMDAEKGAKIVLDAANPSLTTPNTRVGLFYQLREGVSIEGMANGDSTIGDGNPWSPEIKVKGGNSAFYSIGVGKGE